MRETLWDHCLKTEKGPILRQWDFEKNDGLTPRDVSYGSHRKIWWRCERGHHWQAAVYTRAGTGTGCPYCAGKRVLPGETDLASQYPMLAAEWHPTKNGDLLPETVLPGSHKKVWWICGKGHEWQAAVKSRVEGCGCPVCANREIHAGENDLAAAYPDLASQWHPDKNGALAPGDVVPGTMRRVWWICEKGHEWQAAVASRSTGAGCPVCAGKVVLPGENDLASLFPGIAAQWNTEKNGMLTPDAVSPYSNRRVWWRCELGHTWQSPVGVRTMRGDGCPYCSGRKVLAGFNDLATTVPGVAAQWAPSLNGGLTPEMVTAGSHRKVWWQCPVGHVWKTVVYARAGPQRSGCPVCAGTVNERRAQRYQTGLVEPKNSAAEAAFDI